MGARRLATLVTWLCFVLLLGGAALPPFTLPRFEAKDEAESSVDEAVRPSLETVTERVARAAFRIRGSDPVAAPRRRLLAQGRRARPRTRSIAQDAPRPLRC